MIALVVLFTVVGLVGLYLVIVPPTENLVPPRTSADTKQLAVAAGSGLAATMVILLLSGWPIAALAAGVGVVILVRHHQRRETTNLAETERLDALASWIENVRDVLMAGEQPVGAIQASVSATEPEVRVAVRRLAASLGRQEPEVAFRRFADDFDDPVADLVAAGLIIAIRRGARTVPVLTQLADQTRAQVERRRLVEAERAPAQREVQAVTALMVGLLVLLLVLGRSQFLDPYDQVEGQVFLGACIVGYSMLILRVQSLARFPKPDRFLASEIEPGALQ